MTILVLESVLIGRSRNMRKGSFSGLWLLDREAWFQVVVEMAVSEELLG